MENIQVQQQLAEGYLPFNKYFCPQNMPTPHHYGSLAEKQAIYPIQYYHPFIEQPFPTFIYK
jgi:hypothetical protein